MNISDIRSKKARLFSPSALSLDVTDPEFAEIMARFAFSEVTQFGDQDVRERVLITLSSVIATDGREAFNMVLRGALKVGLKEEEIKEVIYESTAYIGLSHILYFLRETNKELDRIGHDFSHVKRNTIKEEERLEKGEEVLVKLFGEEMKGFSESGEEDQKHIRRWITENCYGDFYTREGLSLEDRELVAFTLVISMGSDDKTIKDHIKSNLNLGKTRKDLIEAASECIPYAGYPRIVHALELLDELTL